MPQTPLPSCPRCHSTTARPDRIAEEGATEARVVIKCDSCRHRWSAIIAIDEHWPELRHRLLQQSAWTFRS
jgi:hypothetical protein